MKLLFVNIMKDPYTSDSKTTSTQPPVQLALLNAATPGGIETALADEQTEEVEQGGTGDAGEQ